MGQDDGNGNGLEDPGGRHTARGWGARLAYGVLAGSVVALAGAMLLRTVRHASEPVYALPAVAVATVSIAAAMVAGGAVGMVLVRRSDLALLSGIATALLLFGALAILSVGILFLIAGTATVRVLSGRLRANGDGAAAVTSGIVISVGLLLVVLVSSQPPLVECLRGGGVRTSSRSWWGGGPSSGGATGRADGRTAIGTIRLGTRGYHYTCRDGRLVAFERD